MRPGTSRASAPAPAPRTAFGCTPRTGSASLGSGARRTSTRCRSGRRSPFDPGRRRPRAGRRSAPRRRRRRGAPAAPAPGPSPAPVRRRRPVGASAPTRACPRRCARRRSEPRGTRHPRTRRRVEAEASTAGAARSARSRGRTVGPSGAVRRKSTAWSANRSVAYVAGASLVCNATPWSTNPKFEYVVVAAVLRLATQRSQPGGTYGPRPNGYRLRYFPISPVK